MPMGKLVKTVVRNKPVVVDYEFAANPKLSAKAKGIFVCLLSLSDGSEIDIFEFLKSPVDDVASIESGLCELRDRGYLSFDEEGDKRHITLSY